MAIAKSLLILGHPRSGRSTLADLICDKYGMGMISIDSLSYTFGKILPELGVHLEPEIAEKSLRHFCLHI